MRFVPYLATCALALCSASALAEPPAASPASPAPADQAQLDKQFEQTLTGATLVGSSAINGHAKPADAGGGAAAEEKYLITKATKQDGDNWLLVTRIQVEGHDIPLPLKVPVKWAGDTPVLTITNMLIPGMGTFTARVVIHGDQYAGVWSGGTHGGQLWGRIEHAAAQPAK